MLCSKKNSPLGTPLSQIQCKLPLVQLQVMVESSQIRSKTPVHAGSNHTISAAQKLQNTAIGHSHCRVSWRITPPAALTLPSSKWNSSSNKKELTFTALLQFHRAAKPPVFANLMPPLALLCQSNHSPSSVLLIVSPAASQRRYLTIPPSPLFFSETISQRPWSNESHDKNESRPVKRMEWSKHTSK